MYCRAGWSGSSGGKRCASPYSGRGVGGLEPGKRVNVSAPGGMAVSGGLKGAAVSTGKVSGGTDRRTTRLAGARHVARAGQQGDLACRLEGGGKACRLAWAGRAVQGLGCRLAGVGTGLSRGVVRRGHVGHGGKDLSATGGGAEAAAIPDRRRNVKRLGPRWYAGGPGLVSDAKSGAGGRIVQPSRNVRMVWTAGEAVPEVGMSTGKHCRDTSAVVWAVGWPRGA